MLKEFTCIICPRGCDIQAEAEGKTVTGVTGNCCPKGEAYAIREVVNPMRNIATSIRVEGGELPLASVRLNQLVPKDSVFDIMAEIRKIKMPAPVFIGEVVIENVLGLDADVVITKTVLQAQSGTDAPK